MHEVVWQEGNSIEIVVWDEVTKEEFQEVLHQLESLCAANPKINVLFDASALKKADFPLILEEYDFYQKYKSHLERIAIISSSPIEKLLGGMFNKFADAEIRVFSDNKEQAAQKWIFPSRLP